VNFIRLGVVLSRAALGVCFVGSVWAQTVEQEALEQQGLSQGQPSEGKWDVMLGAAVAAVPGYPGASSHKARLTPLVSIGYGKLFFVGPYGLGLNAIRLDGFRAGPIIGYEGGRRESSDIALTGLGDIEPSLMAGGFAAWQPRPPAPFEISATVRQAITHTTNGLTGLLRFDYTGHAAPGHWNLIAGPHLEFANHEYEQAWFGVTPLQSQNSGLPVYGPDGGLKEAGIHATAMYTSTSHILFRVFFEVDRLTGDAASSPIVMRRSQLLGGVGAAYHF
jgi:outer membrane protein